ncbi:hypothetical protein AB0I68_17530 [Streptomyces sp. NPDC050448]|uniref:hypothetical protein n=1 Tax=Streptomyces sp. NPDC050448 TaxID=3155404 RepID=UPI00341EBF75
MAADFGQEWGRAQTGVTDQQVGMRLNGAPGGPGAPYGPFAPGGGQDFASTPAQKKTAAGTIETELEPNTKKATDFADEATNAAQKGFESWETAAALKTVSDTWDQQVKVLMGRLSSEKGALRGASGLFTQNDTGVGSQFLSQSKLDHM